MYSIHVGMVTVGMDGSLDDLLIKSSLTQVDKGVEHPESVVILANIEALVMKLINSSIVTIIPRMRNRENVQ